MNLAPELVDVLVDPVDHGPLHYFASDGYLYNERRKLRYGITQEGIVTLLADEAEHVSDADHETLLRRIHDGDATLTGQRGSESA